MCEQKPRVPASVKDSVGKSFVLLRWRSKCLIQKRKQRKKETSVLGHRGTFIPHSETYYSFTHTHTHSVINTQESTSAHTIHSLTHSQQQTYTCADIHAHIEYTETCTMSETSV